MKSADQKQSDTVNNPSNFDGLIKILLEQITASLKQHDNTRLANIKKIVTISEKREALEQLLELSEPTRNIFRAIDQLLLKPSQFLSDLNSSNLQLEDAITALFQRLQLDNQEELTGVLSSLYNLLVNDGRIQIPVQQDMDNLPAKIMTRCILPQIESNNLEVMPVPRKRYYGMPNTVLEHYRVGCNSGSKDHKTLKLQLATVLSSIINNTHINLEVKYAYLEAGQKMLTAYDISSGNLVNRLNYAKHIEHRILNTEITKSNRELQLTYSRTQSRAARMLLPNFTSESSEQQSPAQAFFAYQAQDWQSLPDSQNSQVLTLQPNTLGKDRILSDPHGHDVFIFDRINKLAVNDRLFIAGDLFDRGPDSLRMMQLINHQRKQGKQIYSVRGNHEDMVLNYLKSYSVCVGKVNGKVLSGEVALFARVISEDSYPYEDDTKSFIDNSYYAKSNDASLSHDHKFFWNQLRTIVLNGGAWLLDLAAEQRQAVIDFIEQLPYMIVVKGRFNVVHAASAAYQAVTKVMHDRDRGFSGAQVTYMTWARPERIADSPDLTIDPKRSRMQVPTFLGHNSSQGAGRDYLLSNSVNCDFGTFFTGMMAEVEMHSDGQYQINIIFKNADAVKDFNAIKKSIELVNNIVDVMTQVLNKTKPVNAVKQQQENTAKYQVELLDDALEMQLLTMLAGENSELICKEKTVDSATEIGARPMLKRPTSDSGLRAINSVDLDQRTIDFDREYSSCSEEGRQTIMAEKARPVSAPPSLGELMSQFFPKEPRTTDAGSTTDSGIAPANNSIA